MPTNTTNYGLNKPNINSADDEDLWGDQTNENWDEVDGLLKTAIQTNTAADTTGYSVLVGDRNTLRLGDATGGAFTYALPAAATAGDGFRIGFKKVDASANAITIDANGSEEIDGATTFVLAEENDFVVLVCDGTAWQVTSRSIDLPAASETVAGVIEIATAAEVETGTDNTRAVTPAGLAAFPLLPKGVISFDGTGTPAIVHAEGIAVGATIGKTSSGRYLITLATPRSNAKAPVFVTSRSANAGASGIEGTPTTTTVNIFTTDISGGSILPTDSPFLSVLFF